MAPLRLCAEGAGGFELVHEVEGFEVEAAFGFVREIEGVEGLAAGREQMRGGKLAHGVGVREIGEVLGVPERLTKKTPSDGLSGQSDEDKIGFTYACLDHYILTGVCEDDAIRAKIDRMHRANLHKLQLMPTFPLDAVLQKAK